MNFTEIFNTYKNTLPKDKYPHLVELKKHISQTPCKNIAIFGEIDEEYMFTCIHSGADKIRYFNMRHNFSISPQIDFKVIDKNPEEITIAPVEMLIISPITSYPCNNFNYLLSKNSHRVSKYIVILRSLCKISDYQPEMVNTFLNSNPNWDCIFNDSGFYGMLILSKK